MSAEEELDKSGYLVIDQHTTASQAWLVGSKHRHVRIEVDEYRHPSTNKYYRVMKCTAQKETIPHMIDSNKPGVFVKHYGGDGKAGQFSTCTSQNVDASEKEIVRLKVKKGYKHSCSSFLAVWSEEGFYHCVKHIFDTTRFSSGGTKHQHDLADAFAQFGFTEILEQYSDGAVEHYLTADQLEQKHHYDNVEEYGEWA